MVFKINVSFVLLKEEITNKSVSEILESLPLNIFSSLLRMLLRKIDLSAEKFDNEGGNEQLFQCHCHRNKLDISNLKYYANLWS